MLTRYTKILERPNKPHSKITSEYQTGKRTLRKILTERSNKNYEIKTVLNQHHLPDFNWSFLYPLKTSGNNKFSDFSGGSEKDQWHEMDCLSMFDYFTGLVLKGLKQQDFKKQHFK